MERESRRVGLIVISTDRGLCGGLNINLFKLVLASIQEWRGKGAEVSLVTLGKKASAFFKNINVEIAATASDLGERPQIEAVLVEHEVLTLFEVELQIEARELGGERFTQALQHLGHSCHIPQARDILNCRHALAEQAGSHHRKHRVLGARDARLAIEPLAPVNN